VPYIGGAGFRQALHDPMYRPRQTQAHEGRSTLKDRGGLLPTSVAIEQYIVMAENATLLG